jgi:hypothetical protein
MSVESQNSLTRRVSVTSLQHNKVKQQYNMKHYTSIATAVLATIEELSEMVFFVWSAQAAA